MQTGQVSMRIRHTYAKDLYIGKVVQIDNDDEEKEVTIMKKTKKIVKMAHKREHDLDYT